MFNFLRRKPAIVSAPAVPLAPALLDNAAAAYLAGDTATANAIVVAARVTYPDYFAFMTAATRALQGDLQAAVAAGTIERDVASDRYSEDHVKIYWQSAQSEIATLSPTENANALIRQIMAQKIGALIAQHQPDAVLDFGCAYGQPLFELANRFPQSLICGVDRQTVLKTLNDAAFAAPNLSFLDGNVFDALPMVTGSNNKMLIHVRTGIMVYPAFLEHLYREARVNGFRYVALYEIASLSCVSWQYRDQNAGFASEAHRSTMFIHDYAAALRRAGFSRIEIERMPHGRGFPVNPMLPGDTYVFVFAEV